MDRAGLERSLSIEQSRKFFPFNIEKLDGVFGLRARLRNHGGDRLPLKVSDVDGNQFLRGYLMARSIVCDAVGLKSLTVGQKIRPSENEFNAGGLPCKLDVDGDNSRMRVRASSKSKMQHPR